MTVREVIIKLLECENLDKEFNVEVKVDAVETGYTWCELGIQEITVCNDIGGDAVATANVPDWVEKEK